MKITPPKGRPLLYWTGKKPIERIKSYPVQLVEAYDPLNSQNFYPNLKYEDLQSNWYNLLLEGDNKEVLATLLESGFRGKIDLIYIDPPFASNKDYMRRVKLRGFKDRIDDDEAPLLQQVMYEDIWKRDEYFQWIYERLILMRELLSETGSIYVHVDWQVGHYVKLIMDEVFGEDNFMSEIIWYRYNKIPDKTKRLFFKMHDTIFLYAKNRGEHYFAPQLKKTEELIRRKKMKKIQGRIVNSDEEIEYYKEFLLTRSVIHWIPDPNVGNSRERQDASYFFTLKPKELVELFIKASSPPGGIVLDAFIGSGTTAVVAQELGRRWIGIDVNRGAIQITARRVRKVVEEQLSNVKKSHKNGIYSFAIYKVNDYDVNLFRDEAKDLVIRHLGIERTTTDTFFDGKLGNRLVKIIDFTHPLTLLDLETIKQEISQRSNEERDIVIVCYGQELNTHVWIEDWNKRSPVNKIKVIDLRTDNEKGGFIIHEPPKAKVAIERIKGNWARIEIREFISPSVIKRFNLEGSILQKVIEDFRSMIDFVAIDPNFDGKVFKAVYTDIPSSRQDLIKGKYDVPISEDRARVAVKIVDVLGNEVIVWREI